MLFRSEKTMQFLLDARTRLINEYDSVIQAADANGTVLSEACYVCNCCLEHWSPKEIRALISAVQAEIAMEDPSD